MRLGGLYADSEEYGNFLRFYFCPCWKRGAKPSGGISAATGTCCLAIGNQGVGLLFGGSRRLKRRWLGCSGHSNLWRS